MTDDLSLGPIPTNYIPDVSERSECPPWCLEHDMDIEEGTRHSRTVTVGDVQVEIEQWTGVEPGLTLEGAFLVLPQITEINGPDLDWYMEALQQARHLMNEGQA